MKYRTDFVTNSSSSSFIIGKKDDATVNIEYVYQLIKELYTEYMSKRDALVDYIQNNPKLNLEYTEMNCGGGYYGFKYTDGDAPEIRTKHREINKMIERDFGLSVYDYFPQSYEWLKCKTYEEYAEYWKEKMQNTTDWQVHAPFTIADFFEEKPIEWLHFKSSRDDSHKVNSKSDVLLWYFEEADACFKDKDCDTCHHRRWCNKEECESLKQRIKDEQIPENQACLYLLGRICIHSECGYIPDYVVEQLSEISEFSCNHMG